MFPEGILDGKGVDVERKLGPRLVFTVVALPGSAPWPVRARRLAKCMLRAFGFRCERIQLDAGDRAPPPPVPRDTKTKEQRE
jgi:hypothetical protein